MLLLVANLGGIHDLLAHHSDGADGLTAAEVVCELCSQMPDLAQALASAPLLTSGLPQSASERIVRSGQYQRQNNLPRSRAPPGLIALS